MPLPSDLVVKNVLSLKDGESLALHSTDIKYYNGEVYIRKIGEGFYKGEWIVKKIGNNYEIYSTLSTHPIKEENTQPSEGIFILAKYVGVFEE